MNINTLRNKHGEVFYLIAVDANKVSNKQQRNLAINLLNAQVNHQIVIVG